MSLRSADMHARNEHADEWADRRRARRIESACRSTMRQEGAPEVSRSVRVLDIAERGLRVGLRGTPPALGERVVVELECEVPLRVHLGFDTDALIIDGPLHAHVVRFEGRVIRIDLGRSGRHQLGIEIVPECDPDVRAILRSYVDHLSAQDSWAV